MTRMSNPKQQHRLYSWDDLGWDERRQIVRTGTIKDTGEYRYFFHMGVMFDSTFFDKTHDGAWYTDGGPIYIKARPDSLRLLDVGVMLYGRVVQVRAVADHKPEPYKGRKVPDPSMGIYPKAVNER
jgi:hypothetical protein